MKEMIVDGHVDTILNFYRYNDYDFLNYNNDGSHVDLPRLKKAGIGIEVFALFIEQVYKPNFALERTLQLIDKFYWLLDKCNNIELIRNYNDINRILEMNKIGIILAIEGADCVFDLSALRNLYRLGIRLITITWNQRNQLADGIGEIEANGGLTNLGRDVIEEMDRLGIIIDVSHLAPASFWDVIKYSNKSVVASHSNAYSVCGHPRNLNDEQLYALAEKGGLTGINFCPAFLNNSGNADINDLIKHIYYIKENIGIKYIGFGTDFDGINVTPEGLSDISYLPKLRNVLLENNFSKEEINDIFMNNWLRVFKNVLGG